jgi:hypothetical protein
MLEQSQASRVQALSRLHASLSVRGPCKGNCGQCARFRYRGEGEAGVGGVTPSGRRRPLDPWPREGFNAVLVANFADQPLVQGFPNPLGLPGQRLCRRIRTLAR